MARRAVVIALVTSSAWASGQTIGPAVPIDPVTAIVDAFRTHDVVALGEGDHGNNEGHAFRVSLVSDPRFAALVNDIVVEFGSARHQPIVDRYVSGEAVQYSALRRFWEETTQPNALWHSPIYADFVRAVRAANAGRPRAQQLRVLGGEPPIAWESVARPDDFRPWLAQRETHAADVIRREVLAKKRKALVIYGDMHFQRKNISSNYDMTSPLAQGIVSLLEGDGARVFSIWTTGGPALAKLHPDTTSWPAPSVALTRGTRLGGEDFASYSRSGLPRIRIRNGQPDFSSPLAPSEYAKLPMEDQFNAVLYLGPVLTFSPMPLDVCGDAAYMKMRRDRVPLAGMPPPEQQRLDRYCDGLLPQ
jgi:hypothetical protein